MDPINNPPPYSEVAPPPEYTNNNQELIIKIMNNMERQYPGVTQLSQQDIVDLLLSFKKVDNKLSLLKKNPNGQPPTSEQSQLHTKINNEVVCIKKKMIEKKIFETQESGPGDNVMMINHASLRPAWKLTEYTTAIEAIDRTIGGYISSYNTLAKPDASGKGSVLKNLFNRS